MNILYNIIENNSTTLKKTAQNHKKSNIKS